MCPHVLHLLCVQRPLNILICCHLLMCVSYVSPPVSTVKSWLSWLLITIGQLTFSLSFFFYFFAALKWSSKPDR